MKIVIESIPHSHQRYPTCGDYWIDNDGTIQIRVSEEMGDDSGFLVAFHEQLELWMLRKRGVTIQQIDEFDIAYEKAHREGGTLEGKRLDESEPGDDLNAPYFREHAIATSIECLAAAALGVDWKDHDANVEKLP